jgi:fibronectin-binding autotransporter adhesin
MWNVTTFIADPNPSKTPSDKPMKSKLTVFATIALATHSAHALNINWADIGGNTDWNTGSSWVDGAAPANSTLATADVAIFTSVANAQPNLPTGTRSVYGIDFQLPAGGLNFTSAAAATLRLGSIGIDATTQLSGESTVSVEKLQANGGSHEWTLFSNTSNSSTSTFSVSSDIELNTNLTVRSNRNSAGNNVGIVNLSGDISEIGGIRNLTLSSPSAVRNTINLTGNSSYSGTTTIQQVAVTANSLANGGSNSALGSSGDIILGSNASVATLTFQNLSVDGSTDRLLSLRGTLGTEPYILANNDADNTIAFTNAGNTGDTVGTYANDLIFALGGTNTGNNTFGQVINDRNATKKTILRKENPGTWVLTNINTYTGETTVNGGLLRIDNAGALGSGNLDVSGGVLGLGAGDLTDRTVGTAAGEVTWTGSGGFAAFGADRTVRLTNPPATLSWTAANFIGNGRTLILGHASADATLIWNQTINLAGGSRTVQVNDGSAAIDAKISGNINGSGTATNNIFNKTGAGTLALTANCFYGGDTNVNEGTLMIGDGGATGGTGSTTPNIIVASGATLAVNRSNTLTQGTNNLITAISGDGGFAQVGSGTTEFALANVYTGPTTIAAGTLKLNVSGVLPDTSAVTIGTATLNTADGVAETTGKLAVTGAATINLGAGATLVFDDSELQDWNGGSLNITGDFVAGSSIKFATSGGLSDDQLAVISVNGGGTGTYTLNASGYLDVGGSSPYDTWAGGPGLPFDGDANGDGVSNGLAFLLGADDKDENAINRLPTVTQSGGNLVLDFDCLPVSARSGATFKVEHSTDLVGWTATTAVVPDATIAVPDNDVTFEVEAGPEGPPALNSVQATIGSAAAAGGGKLFARLKAEKP